MSGGITTTPWVHRCVDKAGVAVTATFAFNTSTRALTSCVVTRGTTACMYTKLWIGKGANGMPDSTTKAFTLSGTSTTITAATLTAAGLSTIDNVLANQITCG